MKWTQYNFADGTYIIVNGKMSAGRKAVEEKYHGKVVKIIKL